MRQLWLEMVSKVWGSRRRKSIRRCSSIFTLKKAWRSSICQNSLRRWQIAATSSASGTRLGDLQLQIGSIGGLSEMHKSYREAKWEESGPESIYNRRITRRRRGRRNSGEEIHPPQGSLGAWSGGGCGLRWDSSRWDIYTGEGVRRRVLKGTRRPFPDATPIRCTYIKVDF
jgi:hypothetical protein